MPCQNSDVSARVPENPKNEFDHLMQIEQEFLPNFCHYIWWCFFRSLARFTLVKKKSYSTSVQLSMGSSKIRISDTRVHPRRVPDPPITTLGWHSALKLNKSATSNVCFWWLKRLKSTLFETLSSLHCPHWRCSVRNFFKKHWF